MFPMLDSSRSTTRPEPQPGHRTFQIIKCTDSGKHATMGRGGKSLNLTTRSASNVYVPQESIRPLMNEQLLIRRILKSSNRALIKRFGVC